jgi:tetratricopeptide (TPR) repeat protein
MAKKKKSTTTNPSWVKHAWWVIPMIAIAVYLPAFQADFTLDDVPIIEENSYIKSIDKIPMLWTSHYWAGKVDANDTGLYRPLTLTTYNLQYAISGDNPAPFHIVNILLHALVCLLLFKMTSLLFGNYRLSVIAGLLFAVHPIHTEAVAGIVGRAEILAALFILTSMISYHHWRLTGQMKWMVALLLSTFAAITSKEHGFLIPAILVLQEVYYFIIEKKYTLGDKRKWVAIGCSTLLAISLWAFRSTIVGPSVPHEQWLDVAASSRMATSIRIMADYIYLHIWPLHLSADYWTLEEPIVGFGNAQVIVSALMMAGFLGLAYYMRRKIPVVTWGILFFLLMLLPVSNFLFAAGFLKAERILYIPSIGLLVAIAGLIVKLIESGKGRISGLVLLGCALLFYTGRTWIRTGDWKNNYSLALATLKTSPDSPRFNNMMGLELRAQKNDDQAMVYFEKAVKSNPHHVSALVNLGMEYAYFKRTAEAVTILEKAISIDPNTAMAYVNLMSVYRTLGNYDKNLEVAKKALERFPEFAPVLWNAANAYHLKQDMRAADSLRAKANAIDPSIGAGK